MEVTGQGSLNVAFVEMMRLFQGCTCGSGLTTTDPEAPVSGGLDQRWMQEDTRDPASVQEHQYAWQPHPATTQAQPELTCREQADGKELVLTATSLVRGMHCRAWLIPFLRSLPETTL